MDLTEQKKTLKDVKTKITKHHKCAILRPTGFGKTYLMTDLIKEYKNVLYIYPSAIIKDTVVSRYIDQIITNMVDEENDEVSQETIDTAIAMFDARCNMMTYAKLIRLSDTDFADMHYDLIIFDECHRMGAHKTRIACEKLFAYNKDADFIGATATPTRSDNIDIISIFFSNITTYPYTLSDAIRDGILQKPIYCYCTYDNESDLKEASFHAGNDPDDPTTKEVMRSKLLEMNEIFNVPTIIREVCDAHAKRKSYMKFIAFFASKIHMNQKLDEVLYWICEAYPNHEINVLKITSRNREEADNINYIDDLTPCDNHIDIIACIDMLNLGYHVEYLTGILMCRGTHSNTIFIQQLGRVLSISAVNSAIVFDIVDNLHRKAVYDLKQTLKDEKTVHKMWTPYFVLPDNKTIALRDDDGNIIKSQYRIVNGLIVDMNDNPMTFIIEDGQIYDVGTPCKEVNTFTDDCISATHHIAKYKEFLAKAVAEPLTQRCKYALELHFRTWCHRHEIQYPISDKNLKRMYNLDKSDFYKEFSRILKRNKIKYPLQDANQLLKIGEDGNTDIPLKICAKTRQVSVQQILDLIVNQE